MRTVPLAVLLVALFILGSVVLIPKANALPTTNWTGAWGDEKWETAGNWDNGVPTSGVHANIPAGAFVVTISTAQSPLDLGVGFGDTLICTATCTLTVVETLTNSGNLSNYGIITLSNVGPGLNNVGTFTNFGTVTSGVLANDGTFTNSGTVKTLTDLVNVGTFTNSGTVTIGVAFDNDGTFTNRCHGTVNMTPTSGTGTFTTDPTCPAVGGVVTTVNAFSILAPWIAVLGLVGCIGTAVVVAEPWKKREN